MEPAITVDNLGKSFSAYHTEKPVTIMEAALAGLRKLRPIEQFWALRHISFTVAPGEMLGVIGHNGAGKSTLLQLIGGVGRPTEGQVHIRGRIGALLDLGASFHGDLTGRENAFVMAIVAGLTKRDVQDRFDQIVTFSELEPFIDNPVRTYSTGMQMRLAFSVAVHTHPDVLLVDEFLSVGDISFQKKCLTRIAELKQQGCAIILISHDTTQVEQLCDHALWLRQGKAAAYGKPTVVSQQYRAAMQNESQRRTPDRPTQLTASGTQLIPQENRFGSFEAEITQVRLFPMGTIHSGECLKIEIEYQIPESLIPVLGISISHESGQICLDVHSEALGAAHQIRGRGKLTFTLERLDLLSGQYYVNVGLYQTEWQYAYDFHWQVYPLTVYPSAQEQGFQSHLCPPSCWDFQTSQSRESELSGLSNSPAQQNNRQQPY